MATAESNYSFEIRPNQRRAYVTMGGQVDGHSVVAAITDVYSDDRWRKDFDVVWDLTGVKELHFEWKDYEEWLDMHKELADQVRGGRCLILVSSDVHEAILKTYAQLSRKSPRQAFVFRTQAELERSLEGREEEST